MLRKNFPGRREKKRKEAEARQVARSKKSAQEQLALLDKRFGPVEGALKERRRLRELMDAQER